jgi:hypothetical protein
MSSRSWCLYYGQALIVSVVPDSVHAGMWRIVWPDGRTSDMVNLSRAKDAAFVLGERGRDPRLLRWARARTTRTAVPAAVRALNPSTPVHYRSAAQMRTAA